MRRHPSPKNGASPAVNGPPPRAASPIALFLAFLRLGLTAFGGPAMIPAIRREMVDKRAWVTEEDFASGLAAAQLVPGATAMQTAACCGLRASSLGGALGAYLGFGLPAFLLICGLSFAYFHYGRLPAAAPLLAGLKVLVVALLFHGALDFARKYPRLPLDTALALLSGLAFALGAGPISAILGACLLGAILYRDLPRPPSRPPTARGLSRANLVAWSAVILVLGGLGAAGLALRPDLADLALMMAKVDLLAFGGGYASLPLMLHEVVAARAMMGEGMFLDGVALGQMTPGPIVMTAAFVGYKAASWLGAVVATVAVFTPSFLLILLAAPNADRLAASPLVRGALRGSLMSLVGLLAATAGMFLLAAPWTWKSVLLGLGALLALRSGADVVGVVLGGALASILFL